MPNPRLLPTFLATDGVGIARAAPDGSDGWTVTRIATGAKPHALSSDPFVSGAAFAGTSNGVLRTTDRGGTWQPVGLAGTDIRAIAASPAQAGLLFAGARPCALFVSRDCGSTWAELPAFRRLARWRAFFSPAEWPPTPYVSAIALSCAHPARLVVGMEVGGVAATADGGVTWSVGRGAIYDCHSLAAHASNPLRFYQGGAGFGKAGRTSVDGGLTWFGPRSVDGNSYGWASAGDPTAPDTWYYSASSSPFKAHNNGRAEAALYQVSDSSGVVRVGGGLPQAIADMPYQLFTGAGALYMGLANGAIWRSSTGGAWEKLSVNLGSIHRALIAV